MRLNSNIFTSAAELQHNRKEKTAPLREQATNSHSFSCLNIVAAIRMLDYDFCYSSLPYRNLYKSLYGKPQAQWWPDINGEWDHESRIFALLFAAEIVKDANHPKRHK